MNRIALWAALAAPIQAPPDERFPELDRGAEHRRGLVVLCADERGASALPPDRAPRARLFVRAEDAAPSLERLDGETRIGLVPGSRELVDDRARWLALDGVESFVLDDASVVDWSRALYPDERRTVLASALWRRHVAGADVRALGRSAAAASGACPLEPADLAPLRWRASNPRDAGESLTYWSLGFFPWALVDVAGTPNATFRRLVERAWRDRLRLGVWLPPETALVADVARGTATARGAGPVVWLDLKRARRSRQWLLGGRLSLLAPGGRWDHVRRRVLPAKPGATGREATDATRTLDVEDVLGEQALVRLLEQFGGTRPPVALVLRDEEDELRVDVDDESELWTTADGAPLATRLRLDLHVPRTKAAVR